MLGDGRKYEVPKESHLRGEGVKYQKGHTCSMRRLCAVSGERVCNNRRVTSAVQRERVCSTRRVTSALLRQGVQYKEKVHNMKRVTSK